MRDCLLSDRLSRVALTRTLRSLFLVASLALVFLISTSSFFLPASKTHAEITLSLVWGDVVYDDETGDVISDDQIHMFNGEVYQVPFGVTKSISVLGGFYTYGHLYQIEEGTGQRIDKGQIGWLNTYSWAWDAAGTYEVDVYDLGRPVLSKNIWQKTQEFFLGKTAYADDGDFLGTIHFKIEPVQIQNSPTLSLAPDSSGVSPEKGSPNTTTFTFSAVYTDADNTAPASIAVAIDAGAPHTLTSDPHATGILADGTYSNGEAYSTSFTLPEKGEYTFAFTASDGTATTTLQASQSIVIGNSNVAFFPGVQSTYLYKDGFLSEDQVWLPTPGALDNDVGNLFMNPSGESEEDIYTKEGDILLKAFNVWHVYEGFPEVMDSLVSNGTINKWKPIVYDWRLDLDTIVASGKQDGEKISYLSATDTPYVYQELKNLADTSQSGKVSIIAHSNGGLLAKAFLADLEARNDPLLAKIDLLVLVASPQLGTPKALLPMLHGYSNPLGVADIGLEYETWRGATRYSSAAYNLLPSERYFSHTPTSNFGSVITFGQSLDQLAGTIQYREGSSATGEGLSSVFDYRTRYGDEIHTYAEMAEFLKGVEGRPDPGYEDTQHPTLLSESLLNKTNNMHDVIDAWSPPDIDGDGNADIRVVQVVGSGVATIKGVSYESKKNIYACSTPPGQVTQVCGFVYGIEANPVFTSLGDETVVLGSASAMPMETYYVDLLAYNEAKIDPKGVNVRKHANIMAAQPITHILSSIIQGNLVGSIDYVSTTQPTAEDMTVLEMHSPVELEVFDGEGERLGWSSDPSSGITYLEEGIPNASYWKLGDATFIALPSDAPYTVKLDGLATGTFTLKVKKLENDEVVETTSYSDLSVTDALKGQIVVPVSSPPAQLALDTNGDGTTDTSVQSDQVKESKTLSKLIANFKNLSAPLASSKEVKGSLKQCLKDLDKVMEPKKKDKKHKEKHEKEKRHDDDRDDICKEFIKDLRHKKSGINKGLADALVAILKDIKEVLKR